MQTIKIFCCHRFNPRKKRGYRRDRIHGTRHRFKSKKFRSLFYAGIKNFSEIRIWKMGDIKLKNGVSGRLAENSASGPVIIQIPPGPSVTCLENSIVMANRHLQYQSVPDFGLGKGLTALTAKEDVGEVFLAPERGNAITPLRGDFVVVHPWSVFGFSDVRITTMDLKTDLEPPHQGFVHIPGCVSVSGSGVVLLAGHGSILKCVLETKDKAIVCDSNHLLAFSKDTHRICVPSNDQDFCSYRMQFTGPGVVYLQTKIKS